MGKKLDDVEIAQYHDQGWVSPVRVMSEAEAIEIRKDVEAFEARQGRPLHGIQKTKCALLFPSLYRVASNPEILDAVEDLIGPNILMYQNGAWFKEPETGAYVSWHQDSTYYGMDPLELVTAWVAISPATIDTGCMQVLPGSHKLGQLPVDYSEVTPENLLSSGQNTLIDRSAYTPVTMSLEPGEMSLHHCAAVHASRPNTGSDRRIGFSLAYVPTHVRQHTKNKTSAMLMRGEDDYGYYILDEVPPVSPDDPDTIARHSKAVTVYRNKTLEFGNQTAWQRIG